MSVETQLFGDPGPEGLVGSPGTRAAGADQGDPKWVATPTGAVEAGADYLVVGRRVTQAADPAVALKEFRAELTRSGPF